MTKNLTCLVGICSSSRYCSTDSRISGSRILAFILRKLRWLILALFSRHKDIGVGGDGTLRVLLQQARENLENGEQILLE